MGLFDLFKKQAPETSPAHERYLKAKAAFEKKEYQEALGLLIEAFNQDVDYMPLYRLSADCLGTLGGQDEQQFFEQALATPGQFEAYQQLGEHFFQVEHFRMAMPFLKKALSLNSTHVNTAHLLAVCYAKEFQVDEALRILESIDLQKDFWAVHFLNKCRILNNKLEGVKEEIYGIRSFLEKYKDDPGMEVPIRHIDELTDMLYRCRLIAAPEKHIRDWHFIQYGGVVLDYFDSADQYVAGGRYVALWGNHVSIKTVIHKLRIFLDTVDRNIRVVAGLPDRDSEITGRAVAAELGCSYITYNQNSDLSDALIVSADTSLLNGYGELEEVKNGQLIFTLNHSWLGSALITPDIIGFMSQSYWYPWGEGQMRINETTQEVEHTPADNRTPAEIANDIHHAPAEEKDLATQMDFYRKHAHALKGIGEHATLRRYNFLTESPVPGSYFRH
ncbi:tetratricopeptide repeat protein [Chitinophaga tropicalis]|uniref:Tetratricopeptide repeat protein n=1 Tax=Chitinophaga tropicalis TaxID=2683588 RepID=A0A7K1U783_9BACT|nr:hypothetical protein [Chitinophaga tropicalis]MVT10224.1 hypothetical protein [Chitinophaga tropicalis]